MAGGTLDDSLRLDW